MTTAERPEVQTIEENEIAAITVTPVAAQKIRELLVQREIPDHALRVFVAGGGCSGMQYGMAFESNIQEYDTVVQNDDVRIVIDATSLMYMQGAVIDFVDSLMGGGFRIDNPMAVSSCGCGHSFRTGESSDEHHHHAGGCSTCG